MKVYVLWGQRKEQYDGQYAPEVMLAWDEYAVEDNSEGWEEAVEKAKKEYGSDMQATRVIAMSVDGDKIRSLLIGMPTVKAEIVHESAFPTGDPK